MADFELDKESVDRAAKLSSGLMHDLRMVGEDRQQSDVHELFSERRYAEQAKEVPINDVVANIHQMATEFAIARHLGGEIPCLKMGDGELAPIAMAEFLGGPLWPFPTGSADWVQLWERFLPFSHLHHLWREILQRFGQQQEQVMAISVHEAEEGVERSLSSFLSYRFAGMKSWTEWIQGIRTQRFAGPKWLFRRKRSGRTGTPPPPGVGPAGGLQVQVSCLTPGLRIHISPAYFINWVFFGSPTTPVTSYVLPGRYVFAGDGPLLLKRTMDPGVFSIPPTYHPNLVRF